MGDSSTTKRRIAIVGGFNRVALGRWLRALLPGDEVRVFSPRQLDELQGVTHLALETSGNLAIPEAARKQGARVVLYPAVSADFLFPHTGRQHPLNRANQAHPPGPFGLEHGDSALEAMRADGVPPDEAVRRYLALDIASTAGLDRKLEQALRAARQLDERTGFALAPLIETRFRTERLFISRGRADGSLLRAIGRELLARLGLPEPTDAALAKLEAVGAEQPLHPGVIAHFGLTYAGPATEYAFPAGETSTFERYCRLYLAYPGNGPQPRPQTAPEATAPAPEVTSPAHEPTPEATAAPATPEPAAPQPVAPEPAAPEPAAPEPETPPAETFAPITAGEEDLPLAALAARSGPPPLPFELPPEPPPAPKKKTGLFGRLFGAG